MRVKNETHPGVWTLCGFTNDLHDEVSFRLEKEKASDLTAEPQRPRNRKRQRTRQYLLIEVGFSELQRVEERVSGGEFDVVTGLLLPHALDDGRQDLVGVVLKVLGVLTNRLQGKSNRCHETQSSK